MEENINIINSVGIDEREEIIVDFARWLETAFKRSAGLWRRDVRNDIRQHGRSNAGQCRRTYSR